MNNYHIGLNGFNTPIIYKDDGQDIDLVQLISKHEIQNFLVDYLSSHNGNILIDNNGKTEYSVSLNKVYDNR